MSTFLSLAFRFLRLLLNGYQAVVIENAALGMQIARISAKEEAPGSHTL
jgi:hypothetical protein